MTADLPGRDPADHAGRTALRPVATSLGRSHLAAILGGRCPRCREGRVFRGRLAMSTRCPSCALRFEREPGYFTGAMYVSYALALPILAALAGLVHLAKPTSSLSWTLCAATLLFLPFVPAVFRASRVLWIHLDRGIDPEH